MIRSASLNAETSGVVTTSASSAPAAAFLNPAATTYPRQDRAELFAYAMTAEDGEKLEAPALHAKLEALCKEQMPTAQSAAATEPQTAEMPNGFHEVADDEEPLPWGQDGADEDDDFELNI